LCERGKKRRIDLDLDLVAFPPSLTHTQLIPNSLTHDAATTWNKRVLIDRLADVARCRRQLVAIDALYEGQVSTAGQQARFGVAAAVRGDEAPAPAQAVLARGGIRGTWRASITQGMATSSHHTYGTRGHVIGCEQKMKQTIDLDNWSSKRVPRPPGEE